MSEQNKIQLFENQPIRTAWNEEQEEWYFSVVDVIHVLTGSENPRRYWSDLKRKLKSEGATQLYENIVQLKMKSSDGKNYKTDAATTEQLLRIIQSIPSPRAEPVKRWLAEVGRERIEETIDPEQAIDRALETYLKKGYDPDWVHQRLLSIRIRNELTDEWQKRGVEKGREFAILTDEITRTWSGMTTRQYKNLKGLKKENLRDNMSDTELVLTIIISRCSRKMTGNPVYRLSSKENLMKRIYHFYLTCMTLTLTMPMMIVSAFAVDDMWTVANNIIVDVYGKIVGVSTVLAGLMSAVAVIGAKLSNNQHKVDQAWDWLKRIWIAWAIINGIGAFIAYVAPLFNGLATLTP